MKYKIKCFIKSGGRRNLIEDVVNFDKKPTKDEVENIIDNETNILIPHKHKFKNIVSEICNCDFGVENWGVLSITNPT